MKLLLNTKCVSFFQVFHSSAIYFGIVCILGISFNFGVILLYLSTKQVLNLSIYFHIIYSWKQYIRFCTQCFWQLILLDWFLLLTIGHLVPFRKHLSFTRHRQDQFITSCPYILLLEILTTMLCFWQKFIHLNMHWCHSSRFSYKRIIICFWSTWFSLICAYLSSEYHSTPSPHGGWYISSNDDIGQYYDDDKKAKLHLEYK